MNKLLTLLTVLGLSVVLVGCTEVKSPPKANGSGSADKPADNLGMGLKNKKAQMEESADEGKASANGEAAGEQPKADGSEPEAKPEGEKKEEPKADESKEEPKADENK